MKLTADHTTEDLRQRYAALQEEYAALQQQNAELAAKLRWFEEQFRLAQQRRFGSSSERTAPDQLSLLFDEVEITASTQAEEPTLETITYHRQKPRPTREDRLE